MFFCKKKKKEWKISWFIFKNFKPKFKILIKTQLILLDLAKNKQINKPSQNGKNGLVKPVNMRVLFFVLSFLSPWVKLEMLLIPNALCWSSRKCNCTCALPAEVQLHLRVTRRSWQKLFAGKNFVKILVTVQTQLRSYSEQQRAFGNSNICNWSTLFMIHLCCVLRGTIFHRLMFALDNLNIKKNWTEEVHFGKTWIMWEMRW